MSFKSLGVLPVHYYVASGEVGKLGEWKVGKVEVLVDPIGLSQALGPRAVLSKSGKSVEAGGRVVVRCVK